MPYCNKCGAQLRGDENNCPQCGAQIHASQGYSNAGFQQYQNSNSVSSNTDSVTVPYIEDSGSAGWGVLAALIPITGIVLFFIWKNTRPRCAKAVGIGTIVGIVIAIVSFAIFSVSLSSLLNSLMYYM